MLKHIGCVWQTPSHALFYQTIYTTNLKLSVMITVLAVWSSSTHLIR